MNGDVRPGFIPTTDTADTGKRDGIPTFAEEPQKAFSALIGELTASQKRALAVSMVVMLLLGTYFLRGYFILIVVATVSAYLLAPLFNRLNRHFRSSVSATRAVLSALGCVIVPEEAARIILGGVANGEGIIAFPDGPKERWRQYRTSPETVEVYLKELARLRRSAFASGDALYRPARPPGDT